MVGLHDCYAAAWLPHYPRFLEQLRSLSSLATCDQVSRTVMLSNAA